MATKRYNGEEESLVDQDLADQDATMMLKRGMEEGERDEKALPAGYKVEPEAPAAKPRNMRSGPGRSPTGAPMSSGPGRKPTAPAPKKSAEEMRDEKVRNAYRAATDDIKSSIKSAVTLPSAPKREVPAMLRDAAKNARGMGDDKPKFRASQGYAKGGSVSSASRRADGIATKGKTRGKMC